MAERLHAREAQRQEARQVGRAAQHRRARITIGVEHARDALNRGDGPDAGRHEGERARGLCDLERAELARARTATVNVGSASANSAADAGIATNSDSRRL